MGTFIAITGLSGTGKSTLAMNLRKKEFSSLPDLEVAMMAADDYFMRHKTFEVRPGTKKEELVYDFDPRKLGEAHASCMARFLGALRRKTGVIIVHNTFSRIWELDNYVTVAKMFNYNVRIIEIRVETIEDLHRAFENNIHRVPASAYGEMLLRWETYPGAELVKPWWRGQE